MDPIQQERISQLERTILEQQARIDDYNLFGEIKKDLLGSRTSIEAYQVLAYYAPRLFPGAQGMLYLQNPAAPATFERVAQWGGAKQRRRSFTQDQCRALHHMKPHQVDADDCNGLACNHGVLPPGARAVCMPLLTDGIALGVLHLVGPACSLSPWKRKLAEELSNYCAMLLANVRLRELLSEQAVRDPLTRLFNRRYMEESLRRELALRSQGAVGVIMIDIDHFKKYNTKFTHDGGDELLRAFGGFLQKQIRSCDVACRYGGEEFVLILPGASLEATEHRAEKLRKEVKQLRVTHNHHPLGRISVSLGVAVSQPECHTEQVLHRAVWALRKAKAGGRDCVVVAPGSKPTANYRFGS